MTEQELYEELCSYCPNSKKCHEECTNCEMFEEELEKLNNGK